MDARPTPARRRSQRRPLLLHGARCLHREAHVASFAGSVAAAARLKRASLGPPRWSADGRYLAACPRKRGKRDQLCIAHKGFAGFEAETAGRAAHGSRPDLGIDAIAAMGPVLIRLTELAARLAKETTHELLGSASVHVSLIEGGQEYSSYPARCLLTGERRTLPGETADDIREELLGLAVGTDAAVRVTFAREPFEIDPSHEFPQLVKRAAAADGFHGISFWTDAALLAAAGIPTVLYGPAGAGAHATEEFAELDSLERCSLVYLDAARAFCASA